MSSGAVVALGFFAMMTFIVIGGLMFDFKMKTRKKGEPPPPSPAPPTSLSLLAGLSFFCGLGAIFLASVTGILTLMTSMGDLFPGTESTRQQIDLAGRIVLYVSLLPAVGAVAFALAARGVIAESRNTVRGRPLYRTGILLAVITSVIVFDVKILNPTTWRFSGGAGGRGGDGGIIVDPDRGYLGVEHDSPDQAGAVRLIRIVPGSPAETAGLKPGDRIHSLDGVRLTEGESLANRIGALKPGTRISLEVQRGDQRIVSSAVLVAPFSSLLFLLQEQSNDLERLAVLKAAGHDRRYACSEVRQICDAFSSDIRRVDAIKSALPHLHDPENAYQIVGALTSYVFKQEISSLIAERAKKPR